MTDLEEVKTKLDKVLKKLEAPVIENTDEAHSLSTAEEDRVATIAKLSEIITEQNQKFQDVMHKMSDCNLLATLLIKIESSKKEASTDLKIIAAANKNLEVLQSLQKMSKPCK